MPAKPGIPACRSVQQSNGSKNSVMTERERICAEYRRRDVTKPDSQPDAAWFMAARQERERYAAALLRQAGILPLRGRPCLEVGFGYFGWLNHLISLGARESDLHGIDGMPERVQAARLRVSRGGSARRRCYRNTLAGGDLSPGRRVYGIHLDSVGGIATSSRVRDHSHTGAGRRSALVRLLCQ